MPPQKTDLSGLVSGYGEFTGKDVFHIRFQGNWRATLARIMNDCGLQPDVIEAGMAQAVGWYESQACKGVNFKPFSRTLTALDPLIPETRDNPTVAF